MRRAGTTKAGVIAIIAALAKDDLKVAQLVLISGFKDQAVYDWLREFVAAGFVKKVNTGVYTWVL